ncbi:hypothetical protein BH11PLA1_BH11PLA1_05070 [soil metagenome]
MIDTHCHLTFPEFSARVDETLAEAARAAVTGVITIATTVPDAAAAQRIAAAHPRVWCSAGVHPSYSAKGPHDWDELARLAAHPRCVAWGELGLDNHYPEPSAALQRAVVAEQLATIERTHAAWGVAKPIVVHCREAFADLIPVLEKTSLARDKFVFHCFTGTPAEMRRLLDFGAWVSFTGVLTYKNAAGVREAALLAPLDRIMVETDAPFLAPEPVRTKRPCTPAMTWHTARALAEVRGMAWDEMHALLNANTKRFYGVG